MVRHLLIVGIRPELEGLDVLGREMGQAYCEGLYPLGEEAETSSLHLLQQSHEDVVVHHLKYTPLYVCVMELWKGAHRGVVVDDGDAVMVRHLSMVGIQSKLWGLDVLGCEVGEAYLRKGLYPLRDADGPSHFYRVAA